MDTLNNYDKLIIKTILSCKDFNIEEVNDFESIKSITFNKEQYTLITCLILEHNWEYIKNIDSDTNGFREYLEIIKFSDQNKKPHIATIYDSDELWQDPQVLDVFLLFDK